MSHVKEWKVCKDVLVSLQVEVKYHSCALMAKNKLLSKLYAGGSVFWDDAAG